ncbi:MAG TPA: hypothetical protein VJS40_07885 [Aestuariivirgaceae bacterium]|nr:hypothetical protein [Aestuariivirgaceae bacterium]
MIGSRACERLFPVLDSVDIASHATKQRRGEDAGRAGVFGKKNTRARPVAANYFVWAFPVERISINKHAHHSHSRFPWASREGRCDGLVTLAGQSEEGVYATAFGTLIGRETTHHDAIRSGAVNKRCSA